MYSPSAGLSENEIINRLKVAYSKSVDCPYPPGFITNPKRPAAVLLPLLIRNEKWHLLFIHRTHHEDDPHAGQVAFPGGARDPGDNDPISNALRETHEELGIQPEDVEILGKLNDFITITGFQVTPVVGRINWPYQFTLASNEVSHYFTIPLDWLANADNYEIRDRKLPDPFPSIPVIYFQPYDGELLWGASARFTLGLIHSLAGRANEDFNYQK
ncbi:MAG: CoA pyrophosphatase [Anaerolineales bacterium]|nr:MAG: CoA pyrophosphatase [Anaerolineales bacterium]